MDAQRSDKVDASSTKHRQPHGTGGQSASSSTPAASGRDSASTKVSFWPTIGIATTSSIAAVAIIFILQWPQSRPLQKVELSDQSVVSEIAGRVVAQLEQSIKVTLDGKLDSHIATIERKLGAVDKGLADLGERLQIQERHFGSNLNRTNALASEVQRLTERLSQLEHDDELYRLSARMAAVERALNVAAKGTLGPTSTITASTSVNWASKLLGASIDQASTTQGIGRSRTNLLLSWFANQAEQIMQNGHWSDLIRVSKPPEVVLEADLAMPGRCFCFDGSSGQLTVQLPYEILVNTVSLEHPRAALEVEPGSVPRVVFVSDTNGLSKQVEFPRQGGNVWIETSWPKPMKKIQFKVESNWGGMFTCLYGVRVFGRRQAHGNP